MSHIETRAPVREPLTVFIPVAHYHRDYLEQAVASILDQTCDAWHLLIIVDDDKVPHFTSLLSSALRDPRVRLVARQGRLLAGAYNSAMRAARTTFIAVLLGDDLWAPDAVETLQEEIGGHPHVDFFHAGRSFIDGEGRPISSAYLPSAAVTRERFITGSPVKHLLCWRVSTGLACGGVDETLNNFGSDDYDFPWVMLEHGAVFKAVSRPLYVMRDHRDGYRLTTHVPRSVQRRELSRILRKHGVPRWIVWQRVWAASRTYLRQSVFRNHFHRWALERVGFDPREGWREPYR